MASSSESEVEWRMEGKDKGKLVRRVVATQAASISVGEEDFEESTRLATATSTETEGAILLVPAETESQVVLKPGEIETSGPAKIPQQKPMPKKPKVKKMPQKPLVKRMPKAASSSSTKRTPVKLVPRQQPWLTLWSASSRAVKKQKLKESRMTSAAKSDLNRFRKEKKGPERRTLEEHLKEHFLQCLDRKAPYTVTTISEIIKEKENFSLPDISLSN